MKKLNSSQEPFMQHSIFWLHRTDGKRLFQMRLLVQLSFIWIRRVKWERLRSLRAGDSRWKLWFFHAQLYQEKSLGRWNMVADWHQINVLKWKEKHKIKEMPFLWWYFPPEGCAEMTGKAQNRNYSLGPNGFKNQLSRLEISRCHFESPDWLLGQYKWFLGPKCNYFQFFLLEKNC